MRVYFDVNIKDFCDSCTFKSGQIRVSKLYLGNVAYDLPFEVKDKRVTCKKKYIFANITIYFCVFNNDGDMCN